MICEPYFCDVHSPLPIDLTKYPLPRVRHHVSSQVYLSAETQASRTDWYPPTFENIDWSAWFANGRPPEALDIGCGRGGFLLAHALAYPEVNILGLDVRKNLVEWINTVVKGEGYTNIHAQWYSMVNGLGWLPSTYTPSIYYLFPDPWPKNRHFKRRAFSEAFLNEVVRVLTPGGCLYLATDRKDVDASQRKIIERHGALRIVDITDSNDHLWPFSFATDQQRFCERKGIPYTRYLAIK